MANWRLCVTKRPTTEVTVSKTLTEKGPWLKATAGWRRTFISG